MKLKLTDPNLRLRPIQSADMDKLLEIYGSTREKEMERVPHWSDLMKKEFIASQFRAQHEYYQKNYIGADFWVIEKNNKTIGRLYFQEDHQGQGMRIIDISILPEYRNQGIGRGIFEDLLGKAAALDRPLTIHVESFNPAKNLYTRLGFRTISETNGIYHLMEWKHTI
ncbi:GNAT superfamily N-acetyltransferase [Dyadobacter sp. BE34]|uniref:GNAT superfamily N-acetyltransferase n=1 Tax=Dyadobacter fermentans TaxID=94254 RepID=A0ABU1QW82_9BACT|nr:MULTISPECIES: GNAT family N-acetyltransferase [Dyadobacter]MDR6805428.1 GNAT superfamily N-acetyltransferase [Dyadobacter fermentans]MDR7042812.1 GNAT superfamily N-acetyltransferase [Dyadobacter sp. BE242]MDR7197124.1 GNAT superfamily N-acetyltransferase [Dyadobacter sp. BE34]MDR7215441.1 GNAT superfamily N-acetyltransferase [Dyadobacter sp. BE31]MDR7262977.1 GNAT superfamily N-acetyltransferase [Dyadobacter sp. BE32]